jgi:hypothetical protein
MELEEETPPLRCPTVAGDGIRAKTNQPFPGLWLAQTLAWVRVEQSADLGGFQTVPVGVFC